MNTLLRSIHLPYSSPANILSLIFFLDWWCSWAFFEAESSYLYTNSTLCSKRTVQVCSHLNLVELLLLDLKYFKDCLWTKGLNFLIEIRSTMLDCSLRARHVFVVRKTCCQIYPLENLFSLLPYSPNRDFVKMVPANLLLLWCHLVCKGALPRLSKFVSLQNVYTCNWSCSIFCHLVSGLELYSIIWQRLCQVVLL